MTHWGTNGCFISKSSHGLYWIADILSKHYKRLENESQKKDESDFDVSTTNLKSYSSTWLYTILNETTISGLFGRIGKWEK